jgi:4-amino-4-deoxy-L-arabinose transferase-like glycosyltransferase
VLVNKGMKTANAPPQSAHSTHPRSTFTVEVALWALLLAISLGLRLLRLGAAPLDANEARGALAAWRLASGQGAPTASDYSPLLFSGQWFTFLIFGAGDLGARLLPALAGTALVLTPALLRRQLGRLGTLAAGLLLALSPTALTLSRTASGDILAALGALLCAGAFWQLDSTSKDGTFSVHRPLSTVYLLPLGLTLVLVSSPLAYSALLALSAAFLLMLTEPYVRDRVQANWNAFRATPDLPRYTLGTLVGAFLLLSTAFAWNMGGLAAAAHLLPRWLDGFVRWSHSLSLNYPLLILCLYEPLILLTGGVGVILVARQEPASDKAAVRFMALWCIIALSLALIRPGHGPGDVLLVLAPLACLGGLTLDRLLSARPASLYWDQLDWFDTKIFLVISMPLWAHLALNLTNYARRSEQYVHLDLLSTYVSLPTFLGMALVSLVMLCVLVVVANAAQGPGPTLHDLGLSTTLVLLFFTIAAAWGVSQNRPTDPREPLVLEPTAIEVRLLRDSLARISNEQLGDDHAIDLTVLSDDPALAWVLRDFQQAEFTDAPGGPLSTSAIISPYPAGTTEFGEEGYVGQTLPLRRRWRGNDLGCHWRTAQIQGELAHQLDCSALMRWLIFRHSPTPPVEEQVVLWVRQDLVRAP